MIYSEKWDLRFLDLAQLVASWSKDPSTKAGAIIVDRDRRVVSLGYNGFARGVVDSESRLQTRETKYQMIVHCERNALLFARRDLRGCTLYTWPFMSCAPCAAMVIQTGITETVAPPNSNPRWVDSHKLAQTMYDEAGVLYRFVGEEVPWRTNE